MPIMQLKLILPRNNKRTPEPRLEICATVEHLAVARMEAGGRSAVQAGEILGA